MDLSHVKPNSLGELSDADLKTVAWSVGLALPSDLERRTVISEVAGTLRSALACGFLRGESAFRGECSPSQILPHGYCKTSITALLIDENWLYVFWELNIADENERWLNRTSSFSLRVCYFAEDSDEIREQFFIDVQNSDRDQNLMLEEKFDAVRVDLFRKHGDSNEFLAFSQKIPILHRVPLLKKWRGKEKIPMVLRISGIERFWSKSLK